MQIRNAKWFGLTLALGIVFSQLLLSAHQTEHLNYSEVQDCQLCLQAGAPALPGPASEAGPPTKTCSPPTAISLAPAPASQWTLPLQPRAPPPFIPAYS